MSERICGTPDAACDMDCVEAAYRSMHRKSVANDEWPYESYCVHCHEEWPCPATPSPAEPPA